MVFFEFICIISTCINRYSPENWKRRILLETIIFRFQPLVFGGVLSRFSCPVHHLSHEKKTLTFLIMVYSDPHVTGQSNPIYVTLNTCFFLIAYVSSKTPTSLPPAVSGTAARAATLTPWPRSPVAGGAGQSCHVRPGAVGDPLPLKTGGFDTP